MYVCMYVCRYDNRRIKMSRQKKNNHNKQNNNGNNDNNHNDNNKMESLLTYKRMYGTLNHLLISGRVFFCPSI